MTVTSTASRRKEYSGNGSTTNFPITFPYAAEEDVVVLHAENDVETEWINGGAGATGYTIVNDEVVANTAPASGATLVVYRSTERTQETDMVNNYRVPGPVEEAALDKLTLIVQELDEVVSRCVKTGIVEGSAGVTTDTIEAYLDTLVAGVVIPEAHIFDTFADLSAANSLSIGNIVETLANVDPAGAAMYEIVAGSTGTEAQGYFDLSTSGYQAKIVKPTVVNPYMWGAVGDGTTDDTDALNNAYTYAGSFSLEDRPSMFLPAGKFKTISGLTWDKSINVSGVSHEKSTILKSGNYNTITINGDNMDLRDFGVSTTTGAIIAGDTGDGIYITLGSLSTFSGISVIQQGGNGIMVKAAMSAVWERILTRYNGASGYVCDSTGGAQNCNAMNIQHLNALGNADHGLWIKNSDNDYIVGDSIICQQNGKHGAYLEGMSNYLSVYGEANDQDGGGAGAGTYKDIYVSSQAVRNILRVIFATSNAALYDGGTDTIILNNGTTSSVNAKHFGPRTKDSNAAGTNSSFVGGSAGAGATGKNGGAANVAGGDAAGTTGDGNGGNVNINGGAPVNSGGRGQVVMQSAGDGSVLVGSTAISSAGALLDLVSTSKALVLPRMTTTQRNAISNPINGMAIYNTTTGMFEGRRTGTWVAW